MENQAFTRLKKIAEKYFKSLSQMGVKMNKSRQYFYGYARRPSIGDKVLAEIEEHFGINPAYLKYGLEPVFVKEPPVGGVPEEELEIAQNRRETYDEIKLPSVDNLSVMKMLKIYPIYKPFVDTIEGILTEVDEKFNNKSQDLEEKFQKFRMIKEGKANDNERHNEENGNSERGDIAEDNRT